MPNLSRALTSIDHRGNFPGGVPALFLMESTIPLRHWNSLFRPFRSPTAVQNHPLLSGNLITAPFRISYHWSCSTPHHTSIASLDKYATHLSHQPTPVHTGTQHFNLQSSICTDQLKSMGSLLSTIKPKTPSSTTEKTTVSTMGPSAPETFKHYANAQTEFTKTLPLIGNENAFLGDIFTSYALPFYPIPLCPPFPPVWHFILPSFSSIPDHNLILLTPSSLHAATAKTTPSPLASTASTQAPPSFTPIPMTRWRSLWMVTLKYRTRAGRVWRQRRVMCSSFRRGVWLRSRRRKGGWGFIAARGARILLEWVKRKGGIRE